jgi:hypothetical protein
MNNLRLLFIILILSYSSFAQKIDKRNGFYSIQLVSVDTPKDISNSIVDSLSSVYEDDLIKMDWDYGISQLGFVLKNKSNETLKIIWDDMAYISTSNTTEKVFHKGIKYIDREKPQAPTSVYKNTTLSDLVAPSSYTTYVSGQYGGWKSSPLIPTMEILLSKKIEYRQELIGKTLRVAFPIKIEDKIFEYLFTFKTIFIETQK